MITYMYEGNEAVGFALPRVIYVDGKAAGKGLTEFSKPIIKASSVGLVGLADEIWEGGKNLISHVSSIFNWHNNNYN